MIHMHHLDPGKVYNLKVSRYTPDQVKLSWDKVTGASSYKVRAYRKGKVDTLVKDAGSFAFALKDNQIYYSKYKDFIYGVLRTKVFDFNYIGKGYLNTPGGRARLCDNIGN